MADSAVPLGVDTGIAALVRTGKGFRGYSQPVSIPIAGQNVWLAALTNPAASGMVIRLERIIFSATITTSLIVARGTGTIFSGGTVATMINTGGMGQAAVGVLTTATTTSIALAGSPLPTVNTHSFCFASTPVEFISGGATLLQPGQTLMWGANPQSTLSSGLATITVQSVEYPLGFP